MINVDSIAYQPYPPENVNSKMARLYYDTRTPMIDELAAAIKSYAGLNCMDARFPQGYSSDHAPFSARGFASAHLTSYATSPFYHTTSDSLEAPDNVNYEYAAMVTRGVVGYLAAQAGLADREEALLKAQAGLETALDGLKDLVGLPLDEAVMVDTGTLKPIFFEVDTDRLFYDAQMNRPDLLDIDLRTRQAELALFAAQDRVQASLLWNTQVGLSGRGEGYLESFDKLGGFTWSTGLEYRIPLGGNRAAVTDVSLSELNLQQLELERTDFLRTVERDTRSAVEEFRSAVARVDVTEQGLNVQEVKMESERARLDLGLITSRDLLQFDLDLANARLAYASAMADALLSVAKLENLSGKILLNDVVTFGTVGDTAEVSE
jgi:hypothetical protein